MNHDTKYYVLLNTPITDMRAFCSSDQETLGICNSYGFWKEYFSNNGVILSKQHGDINGYIAEYIWTTDVAVVANNIFTNITNDEYSYPEEFIIGFDGDYIQDVDSFGLREDISLKLGDLYKIYIAQHSVEGGLQIIIKKAYAPKNNYIISLVMQNSEREEYLYDYDVSEQEIYDFLYFTIYNRISLYDVDLESLPEQTISIII